MGSGGAAGAHANPTVTEGKQCVLNIGLRL